MFIKNCCYLIHFNEPYYHATHYVGATKDLHKRLQKHVQGIGSKLLAAAETVLLDWEVACVFFPAFRCEQYLKKQQHTKRFCPRCTENSKLRFIPNSTRMLLYPGAITSQNIRETVNGSN